MRPYATGLQLVLLVCAGTASGYLWRAALHPRSTVAPELAPYRQDLTWPFGKPPATAGRPQVRVQARHSHHARTQPRRGSSAVTRHVANSGAELASVATHKQTVAQPKTTRSRPRKPIPRTSPRPQSPPPPPPPSPPPPPPPSAPSPPSPPPAPDEPTPAAAANSSTRPGWGKGDRNHDHAGPPGQSGNGRPKK